MVSAQALRFEAPSVYFLVTSFASNYAIVQDRNEVFFFSRRENIFLRREYMRGKGRRRRIQKKKTVVLTFRLSTCCDSP